MTSTPRFLPHAANGTKPTELLCEVTAGGGLPPALHCRGAVDDQHHGAGTPLEGDVQSKIDGQQPEETLLQKQGEVVAEERYIKVH